MIIFSVFQEQQKLKLPRTDGQDAVRTVQLKETHIAQVQIVLFIH